MEGGEAQSPEDVGEIVCMRLRWDVDEEAKEVEGPEVKISKAFDECNWANCLSVLVSE